jgi:hypothetical protein
MNQKDESVLTSGKIDNLEKLYGVICGQQISVGWDVISLMEKLAN